MDGSAELGDGMVFAVAGFEDAGGGSEGELVAGGPLGDDGAAGGEGGLVEQKGEPLEGLGLDEEAFASVRSFEFGEFLAEGEESAGGGSGVEEAFVGIEELGGDGVGESGEASGGLLVELEPVELAGLLAGEVEGESGGLDESPVSAGAVV